MPELTTLEELLDEVARRRAAGDLAPERGPAGTPACAASRAVQTLLRDPYLRPEHRARILADLEAQRPLLERVRDPRLVDVVYWSEHVERLHAARRSGRLSTFHYARALEATCRRCGFELLPLLARMEELGRIWGGRDLAATWELASPHFVKVEAPREAASELGTQLG